MRIPGQPGEGEASARLDNTVRAGAKCGLAAEENNQRAAQVTGGSSVLFASELRERVRQGRITCSVRIWTRPHVKMGGRYRMEQGEIEVTSLRAITPEDVTPELARREAARRGEASTPSGRR